MPDATITSTASTFGTISGTFAADQSTISGTISGIIPGTLSGSVGVPGPAGPGVPAGGTSGQFLQKTSGVDYATDWVTVNLTGLATESWVTAGFYPLTGNPSGFLTAAALTPYLTSATAASTYQTLAGMSAYLTKADNLGSLTNFATARDNLGLGSLSTPTFAGVNVPGSGTSVANLGATFLTINQQGSGQFTIQPSQGIVFPDASIQTTAFTTAQLTAYLVKASNLSDLTSASSARSNLGLGSLAVVNDAPSDGSQYARKNGAWDVVSVPASYITSVSSPLSVTTGNLSIDLSAYLTSATAATTYAPIAAGLPDNGAAGQILVKQSATAYDAEWQDNFATELRMPARNETGATLTKGTVVYISGGAGNKPLLSKALATGDATSAQTIGLVTADIPNNSNGDVTIRGQLKDIDTSAFSVGAQLYLSGTTAGAYTATKTLAPTHLVYVGIVVRSNATEGAIEVAVQNGYELGEIHDVAIGTLANNDLLAYESSTDLWKNKTYSALGLLTSADAASTYLSKSGGTLNNNASILFPVGGSFTVSNSLSNQGILIRDASNVPIARFYDTEVLIPSVGITFSDATNQTTAGLSPATAASTYYLQTNPAGYITSAALSGLAPLASPALTGNVTITSNTSGAALFIEQSGTGNILTLHDQASDTTFVAIDQNGKVSTIASTTTNAGFNVPHGTAPTSPVNGDVWTTTTGLFYRINASTKTTATLQDSQNFTGLNINLGTNTGTGTIGLATGATLSGSTKTVNIGTSGVAGSTTNIAIGSTTGTSTTTLQGITNGVTQSAGDSSLKLATTAFVTTADNLKANIASPTFTGVPAAPTASAGTNTTQVATTAFVQQEVPAASTTAAGKVELATFVEATRFTSQSLATTPLSLMGLIAANGGPIRPRSSAFTAASSGAGASAQNYFGASICYGPNASTVGYGGTYFDASGFWASGNAYTTPDWSKVTGFSVMAYRPSIGFVNGNTIRITLGKAASGGTLSTRGIGIDIAAANTYVKILAHNGTTLTTTDSTMLVTDYANLSSRNFTVVSYGNGTVELFMNGVSYGTSSGGPTTAGGSGTRYSEEVYGDGTQSGAMQLWTFNASVFTGL